MLLVAGCSGSSTIASQSGGGVDPSIGSLQGSEAGSETAAQAPSEPAPTRLEPSEGFGTSVVTYRDGDRSVAVPVLVADDPGLRATGLMNRTDLPHNAGMVFVFERTTTSSFWMKNTPLPLSIAFIGQDGVVQQIIDMAPCPEEPCPLYEPDDPYLYAVEVHQGFYDEQGVTAGWTMQLQDEAGGDE